jgi:hypothetical protein
MNDYKYLVSSPEVKRAERNDRRISMAVNIIGSVIGGACFIFTIHVLLG